MRPSLLANTAKFRITPLTALAAMLVVGLLLAAPDTVAAGGPNDTTRDHRHGKRQGGGDAEGGVTVNGKGTTAATAPIKQIGGYNKARGAIVRDHR